MSEKPLFSSYSKSPGGVLYCAVFHSITFHNTVFFRHMCRWNAMQINIVGLVGNHFQPSNVCPVRMAVLHSTAALRPTHCNCWRRGGSDSRPVSIHYYIDKAGNISQM